VLRDALFDDDEERRTAALSGLSAARIWGPLSAETATDVCRALYDPSRSIRVAAIAVLLEQPTDRLAGCQDDLLAALDQDDYVTGRALYLLSQMSLTEEARAKVTGGIIKQAHNGIDEYALRAAMHLKLKERRAWTKDALARIRGHRHKNLAAIEAAALLDLRDAETLEVLGVLLADERSYVRSAAAKSILRLKTKEHLVRAWLVLEAEHNDFGLIQPPDL